MTPVVERAMALYEGAGAADEPLDPLTDVAAVLGDAPRMLTQEVLHRLAERRPDAYREWGPADLREAPEPFGAEPYKSGGKSTVARDRVQDAILERLAENIDDEGGDEI